tara:strand:+ start:3904 stop:5061 length:1158 start_codon:yes stop_codon:yes gene_type:complete
MNLTRQAATFGLVATAATTGTNVVGSNPIGTRPTKAAFPDATVAFSFKATSAYASAIATWELQSGIVTATGYVTILDGDGNDFEGAPMTVLDSIYGVLIEFTKVNGTLTIGSTDANFPDVVLAGSGSLLLVANDGETAGGTMALTFSAAGDSAVVSVVGKAAVPILDALGVVPAVAASMARALVAYTGSFYDESAGDVTKVWDQSANGRHLTNDGTTNATLSGSALSARAVFASTGYTVLTTSTLGSAFSGGHDVFIVFDPVGASDQQILMSRGGTANDYIAMDNGSSGYVLTGLTSGNLRVDDVIIYPQYRDVLWDAMNAPSDELNIFSVEDLGLSDFAGTVMLGVKDGTWRLEGSFAELIITPSLSDADHSAIITNIQNFYGT